MATAIQTFRKDPNASLDYPLDWSLWLNGDTISTSAWTVPAGITKDLDSKTDSTTTIWLSGGTLATTYSLINRIVTVGGRTDDRTINVTIVDR